MRELACLGAFVFEKKSDEFAAVRQFLGGQIDDDVLCDQIDRFADFDNLFLLCDCRLLGLYYASNDGCNIGAFLRRLEKLLISFQLQRAGHSPFEHLDALP